MSIQHDSRESKPTAPPRKSSVISTVVFTVALLFLTACGSNGSSSSSGSGSASGNSTAPTTLPALITLLNTKYPSIVSSTDLSTLSTYTLTQEQALSSYGTFSNSLLNGSWSYFFGSQCYVASGVTTNSSCYSLLSGTAEPAGAAGIQAYSNLTTTSTGGGLFTGSDSASTSAGQAAYVGFKTPASFYSNGTTSSSTSFTGATQYIWLPFVVVTYGEVYSTSGTDDGTDLTISYGLLQLANTVANTLAQSCLYYVPGEPILPIALFGTTKWDPVWLDWMISYSNYTNVTAANGVTVDPLYGTNTNYATYKQYILHSNVSNVATGLYRYYDVYIQPTTPTPCSAGVPSTARNLQLSW